VVAADVRAMSGVEGQKPEDEWEKIRKYRWADLSPPKDWPSGIRPISLKGVTLLGVDPKGRLYWDGEEIVVTRKLELTPWQRWVRKIQA
jgi:hypothetical protein